MNNPKWPQIPDRPDRILTSGGSGSGKTNDLLSLICYQMVIDNTYQYAKDSYEANINIL